MSSLNICFFIGNLTRDPELKYTPKGTAVCDVGIAVNEVWKDDSGTKHEKVAFLDLVAWGATAEIIGEHLKKGRAAHFQCRAEVQSWEDKETGKKRSKVVFRIDHLTFLPGGKKEEEREERPPARQQAPPPARKPAPPRDPDLDADEEDDDIPFRSILTLASDLILGIIRPCVKALHYLRGIKALNGILSPSADARWATE